MMSLGDEINQILSVANNLSGLRADDFETLRAIADHAQPMGTALETKIRELLTSHEATKAYADTYLHGDIAGWFRALFEIHDEREFLNKQMSIAVEHVRTGVPSEVVLALSPRWLEWLHPMVAEALDYEKAVEIDIVLTRVLSLATVVMVATYDMVIRRTFIRETGFSEALIRRLQTRALQEIADEIEEENA